MGSQGTSRKTNLDFATDKTVNQGRLGLGGNGWSCMDPWGMCRGRGSREEQGGGKTEKDRDLLCVKQHRSVHLSG